MPDDSNTFWSRYQPGLKWLEDASDGPLTADGYAAIRSSRHRRESHLETVAGFTDYGGKLVVEVGCGIGIDGSRFALLAWPWFNPVATQAVFTRFGGDTLWVELLGPSTSGVCLFIAFAVGVRELLAGCDRHPLTAERARERTS
jgi:hypothetical protein